MASELESLRRRYANIQHEKEKKKGAAMHKAMNGKPSAAQLRLYREGVHKLSISKIAEESKQAKSKEPISFVVNSNNTSPSPVCDRLYQQGMIKKFQQNKIETRDPSPIPRRISSNPVCDRLYMDGLMKIKARNNSFSQDCDEHQRRARSKMRRNRGGRSASRSCSPQVTCDRLYEQGKAKLRSLSKPRLPPRRTESNGTTRRGRSLVSQRRKEPSQNLDDSLKDDIDSVISSSIEQRE